MISSLLFALVLSQQTVEEPPSRPVELLQARSCKENVRGFDFSTPDRDTNLFNADAAPACLAPIFNSLGAEALRLAGSQEATAVLYVGVGRGFHDITLFFSIPEDPQIHYVEDLHSIADEVSAEWSDYLSSDGDLGWSGFVLVADKSQTRVRFLTSVPSPLGVYETAIQLEAEFFPNKELEQSK